MKKLELFVFIISVFLANLVYSDDGNSITISLKKKALTILKQSDILVKKTQSQFFVFRKTATPLEIVYQALSCMKAKKNFNVHTFVRALFKINHIGISKLKLSAHSSRTVLIILYDITFQYQAYSVDEIEKWYFNKGCKQARINWGIDKINEILFTEKFPQINYKRLYIQQITQYFPIYFMSLKEARSWWRKSLKKAKKTELFTMWKKESIAWAINNIESPNTKVRTFAYKVLWILINHEVFVKLGVTNDTNDKINIFDLIDNKEKLRQWFQSGAPQDYYNLPAL